jgi:hypothetical protein
MCNMKIAKRTSLKSYILKGIAVLAIFFAIAQTKRPGIENPPVTGDFEAPQNVKAIIKRACYDCHSNETNLRWYDKIAPVSWQVAEHVRKGRELLNFSEWNNLPSADQKAKLWECLNQINAGAMPVKDYKMVHPATNISAADLNVLKDYLMSMTGNKPDDTAKLNVLNKQVALLTNNTVAAPINLPKALNGIEFIPDYKNWQPISATNRFDNGTMRIIFGNDVAIEAIKNHQINPWPNGTIFAKVAWDAVADTQGNINTGAFKQVEYMIKDKAKYASTHGWGFARFKTPKLIPYGKTVMFTSECINCHQPMSDNDFVFTQPIKTQ